MRKLFALVLLQTLLFAGSFRVATYNVQNLFDLHRSGSEYSEYIPNTSTRWNNTNYTKKLNNLAKVIVDMKPDIIALQEIESDFALQDLQEHIKNAGLNLKYRSIAKGKKSTVKNALLSRFPITKSSIISPNAYDNLRAILRSEINIHGHTLTIFVNHYKSKRGAESKRLHYAKALQKVLPKQGEYLIVGDLNSNYNEYQTFKRSERLNDTKGITGVNHILKTINANNQLLTIETLKHSSKGSHANLWTTLPKKQRASHFYKGRAGTLDHIIIPKTLVDGKKVEYKVGSFTRFSPPYLIKKKRINRWKMSYKRPVHFTGKGYSDHLPLYADFTF